MKAQVIELAFTETLNGVYAEIDSIQVSNLTQGGDTTLYWPDTTLMILNVGIQQQTGTKQDGLSMTLEGNNPVSGQSNLLLYVPEDGLVEIGVSDLTGRQQLFLSKFLFSGVHQFRFTAGTENFYVIKARSNTSVCALKIINAGFNYQRRSGLEYVGASSEFITVKTRKSSKSFFFSQGDLLKFTGFDIGISTVIVATVQSSQVYTFSLGMNIPCQGIPFFTYSGQTYNTVKIGSQCWMKENLNIGTMATSLQTSASHSDCGSNLTVEKYCFNNDPANCAIYGGLYDWDEMMEYKPSNLKGICPVGWHIPSDADWCILTSYLDTAVICNQTGWSGTDIAGLLKEPGLTHWVSPNTAATNQSGFAALGTGYRTAYGYFGYFQRYNHFWCSTETTATTAKYRSLSYNSPEIGRNSSMKTFGYSVRCVKND